VSIRLFSAGVLPAALATLAPAAERGLEPLPAWERDADGSARLVIPLDAATLAGATRVVPSWSWIASGEYAFRFALRLGAADGSWTSWVRLARIGRAPAGPPPTPEDSGQVDDRLGADVDTFLVRAPAAAGELELRLWTSEPGAPRGPGLLAISAAGPPVTEDAGEAADVPVIPVPPLSQMVEPEALRLRVCSPTSVAMVLRAHGASAATSGVAAQAFCADLDRYGVWPAAVWAASRWGALGCVLALPSWAPARALLANGLPLVVSEAHARGGLRGSPLEETDGHLVVLRGIERGVAVVNDPAAPTVETVETRYPLAQFGRAWLGHGGIAYAFVRPAPSQGGPA
jgi:hypothetical protein